jgi:hypothetical protein
MSAAPAGVAAASGLLLARDGPRGWCDQGDDSPDRDIGQARPTQHDSSAGGCARHQTRNAAPAADVNRLVSQMQLSGASDHRLPVGFDLRRGARCATSPFPSASTHRRPTRWNRRAHLERCLGETCSPPLDSRASGRCCPGDGLGRPGECSRCARASRSDQARPRPASPADAGTARSAGLGDSATTPVRNVAAEFEQRRARRAGRAHRWKLS